MKKILLSALLGLFSVTTFAQHNLAVTMIKPVAGQYTPAGATWDVEVSVTNNGTTAIAITDTLAVFPSIAGTYVINGFADFAAIAPGASANLTFVHPALTGGVDGPVSFCVEVYAWNKADTDSMDNADCATILWDTDATVGVEEFGVVNLENNSYYSNGVYNVAVTNAYNQNNIKLSIYSITGQTVFTQELSGSNGEINELVNLAEMNSGIYLFNISSSNGMNLTQKVMVQ